MIAPGHILTRGLGQSWVVGRSYAAMERLALVPRGSLRATRGYLGATPPGWVGF